MKPIAISQRIVQDTATGEWRDALDQRLVDWVLSAGYLPIPVPNVLAGEHTLTPLDVWLEAVRPTGIILSGGNDLGSAPSRDRTEARLLDHARAHALPLLGICRGMQSMAVWAGGTLIPIDGHTATRHALTGNIADREVNSYHNYAVSTPGDGFIVTACATDGGIEALRHRQLPWQGWMWHPERETPFAAIDLEEFRRMMQ